MNVRNGDLVHFTLHVPDLEKAREFYGGVLGWQTNAEGHWQIAGLKLGGGFAEGDGPPDFYFWADDVAAMVERVRALGGESDGAEQGHSGHWAMCRDPQGIRFALSRLIPEFQPTDREPRLAVGELGYWVLPMKDVPAGREFYGELFGWEFLPGESYAHISNTATPGGLATMDGDAPLGWYRVEDIRASLETVRRFGGTPGEAAASESGWSANCKDDQGVAFELWQPAPEQKP